MNTPKENGNLVVKKDAAISGGLFTRENGPLSLEGDCIINGDFYLECTLIFTGSLTVNGSLTVEGSFYACGELAIKGDLIAHGYYSLESKKGIKGYLLNSEGDILSDVDEHHRIKDEAVGLPTKEEEEIAMAEWKKRKEEKRKSIATVNPEKGLTTASGNILTYDKSRNISEYKTPAGEVLRSINGEEAQEEWAWAQTWRDSYSKPRGVAHKRTRWN